ncbi:MAG: hypothetical protein WC839_01395 [Candidatus Paceibacterota bacterium]
MLPQAIKTMKKLREINKSLDHALKINEFVDSYVNECILYGQPVTLITPWSLSRSFKERYKEQENKFFPTEKEKTLFSWEIPQIELILKENNLDFNWWLIFSRSYIRSATLDREQEKEYVEMITKLSEENKSELAIINWEDDVIKTNHQPNNDLLKYELSFEKSVDKKDFEYEIGRRSNRSKNILNLDITNDKLIEETKYKIACEANEGLFLMKNENNPLCQPGNFLFLILGKAERYSFFSTLVPEFKKRIVCVLRPYPWRLGGFDKEKKELTHTEEELKRFRENEANEESNRLRSSFYFYFRDGKN